jgi:hypothetical protein
MPRNLDPQAQKSRHPYFGRKALPETMNVSTVVWKSCR